RRNIDRKEPWMGTFVRATHATQVLEHCLRFRRFVRRWLQDEPNRPKSRLSYNSHKDGKPSLFLGPSFDDIATGKPISVPGSIVEPIEVIPERIRPERLNVSGLIGKLDFHLIPFGHTYLTTG